MSSEPAVSWRWLENEVGLDGLGDLHRALLRYAGVTGADTLTLRRAQQRAEAELNRMAQAGELQKVGPDWLLPADCVKHLAGARADPEKAGAAEAELAETPETETAET